MRTKGREKGIGWRLDYTVVNKELEPFCEDSLIYDNITGSDHCPVGLIIDFDLK
jgi:exodeoxyribonuclease III